MSRLRRDAAEMLPRTIGRSLTVENYPSLARFRFPGIEAAPAETPPAPPRAARQALEATRAETPPAPKSARRKNKAT